MKRSKFIPTKIAKALKEFESGKSLDTISRENGISKGTFTSGDSVFMIALKLASLKKSKNSKKRTLNSSKYTLIDMAKYVIEKIPEALCQA